MGVLIGIILFAVGNFCGSAVIDPSWSGGKDHRDDYGLPADNFMFFPPVLYATTFSCLCEK